MLQKHYRQRLTWSIRKGQKSWRRFSTFFRLKLIFCSQKRSLDGFFVFFHIFPIFCEYFRCFPIFSEFFGIFLVFSVFFEYFCTSVCLFGDFWESANINTICAVYLFNKWKATCYLYHALLLGKAGSVLYIDTVLVRINKIFVGAWVMIVLWLIQFSGELIRSLIYVLFQEFLFIWGFFEFICQTF